MASFLLIVGVLGFVGFFIQLIFRLFKRQAVKSTLYGMIGAFIVLIAGGFLLSPDEDSTAKSNTASSETIVSAQSSEKKKASDEKAKQEKLAQEQAIKDKEEKEQAEKKAAQEKRETALAEKENTKKQINATLLSTEYSGTQTIDVNNGEPVFTETDLSTTNGSWETYGNLDALNRPTDAEALLNLAMQLKEKREPLTFDPTGWHNKKLKNGYLYNRSHLIGFQLSGENNNPKNLITGTRQLNSPEMLRFESDINYYLEQNPDAFVRYSVVPIFKDNELVARGVHLQAQSIGSDAIKFNVYIHNIQDGVTINYSDGTSQVSQAAQPVQEQAQTNTVNNNSQEVVTQPAEAGTMVYVTPTGERYHSHPHGNGSFSQTTHDNATAQGLTPCQVCY